jgi:hypothetical protein
VAHDAILYKDEGMRLLMVVGACTVALSAQVVEPDASAKLKQFEKNLENAMKVARAAALRKTPLLPAAPNRVCAIPLLKVAPDPSFKSNMPVIAPDPKTTFSAREVIPPGPTCGELEKK